MIMEFLKTGDFSMILTRVYVILAMWAIMCIGVCMDLWAGVNRGLLADTGDGVDF